jgi:hypothetical protein
MLLSQTGKGIQQRLGRIPQFRQILIARGKGNPVIPGKGDPSLGGCRFAVLLECDVLGPGEASGRTRETGYELPS